MSLHKKPRPLHVNDKWLCVHVSVVYRAEMYFCVFSHTFFSKTCLYAEVCLPFSLSYSLSLCFKGPWERLGETKFCFISRTLWVTVKTFLFFPGGGKKSWILSGNRFSRLGKKFMDAVVFCIQTFEFSLLLWVSSSMACSIPFSLE